MCGTLVLILANRQSYLFIKQHPRKVAKLIGSLGCQDGRQLVLLWKYNSRTSSQRHAWIKDDKIRCRFSWRRKMCKHKSTRFVFESLVLPAYTPSHFEKSIANNLITREAKKKRRKYNFRSCRCSRCRPYNVCSSRWRKDFRKIKLNMKQTSSGNNL